VNDRHKRAGARPDEVVDQLGVALQRLGRLFASRQVTWRITSAAGVEVGQQAAALLRVLLSEGQMAIAELAAATPMEIAAVSRQVRSLEAAGAIRRTASRLDGRVTLLQLTDEGRDMAERIRAVGVQHLEEALADWSDSDQGTLAVLLRRLIDDLAATPIRPSPAADG
jgi:DNA-binding MarR family transcriptional regulator